MNEHARKLLQFDRIVDELCEYALTEEGRRGIRTDTVSSAAEDVSRRVGLAAAYRRCLELPPSETGSPASVPLNFPEISPLLPRLSKEGGVLEPSEMKAISFYVSSAAALKRMLRPGCTDADLLARIDDLPDIPAVPAAIDRLIDDEGELRERDIPELRAIRGQIRSVQNEIRTLSGAYLSRSDFSGYWNSNVATVKDGRTVLPLKAQYKGRIRGIVHEVSTTGATLFVEPPEIVEKNNRLVETEAKYQQEVFRILRELTRRVAAHSPEIGRLVHAMTFLDGLHARARYAQLHVCVRADSSRPGIPEREGEKGKGRPDLILYSARHPLLGAAVVPVDIVMDHESSILIITGPNTGGKTVSLKTVGLLALMNQFGMEVPVTGSSILPEFDDVFADIGDEQSIEQSLSTFSGHMRNIAEILRGATSNSLILLDELGSGTDPEEGAALAMAVIDRLLTLNVRAMVTTHHSILKNYGYTRDGVSNASMDFDLQSLSPTYRIILGVPGSSHAIDIALRNGIPRATVDAARRNLHDEQTDAAGLIRRLTRKEQDFHRRSRELEQSRAEIEALRAELDSRDEKLRARELELRRGAVADLDRFVSQTRSELERLVRELREGQITRENTREVKAFIDRMDQRVTEQRDQIAVQERERALRQRERTPGDVGPLEAGMEVTIGEGGRRGVLVRKARGDMWVVSTGAMKVTLHEYELRRAPRSKEPSRPKIDIAVAPREGSAVFELDVRGMRLEEALAAVERQIDLASMQGLSRFAIIHGKGEGILQKGIHDYLRDAAEVEHFEFARPEGGGFGKTHVELRS